MASAVAGFVAVVAMVVGASSAYAVQPVRPGQWYLDSWKIEEAWTISQGEGVTVAVIDTGVDASHPDLVGQVTEALSWPGYGNDHGTSLASSIAGTGRGVSGQGVYGVAPKAKIDSYNVGLRDSLVMDPNKVVPAIRAAADSPAKIINLSFGGGHFPSRDEAVAYAVSRGKLVVASAGNVEEYNQSISYPASVPGVLGVGAYDQNGIAWTKTLAGYWVSLAAPGADIVSACDGPTRYCKASGTSGSAALTSGVAALLWAKYPHYTANQIIRVLIDSANKPNVPVPNEYLGYGNVSPRNALNWTGDPGPPDVNPLIGKRGDMPTASPSAAAVGSQSPSPPPTSSEPSAQPPMSPVAAPPGEGRDSDSGVLLPVGIVVAGAAVLGGGVFLFVRSRGNRPGPPPVGGVPRG
ncbi:S8 family serine peptidase [Yinghuangia sp. ASG 101]|uniref:S8 family serine peptidase n=1 Tax=Yinghuangia sp. ASG 101 TaxID=2896848 RepID=UPI001E57D974|nr:S8 family serine peptidase [Yinghuangia sp. ASG 101]UGQ14239.1 S8 family serine peptidase [Yinghuangia sp. ASG 101]